MRPPLHVWIEMNLGSSLLWLIGVALLSAIASFNEMTTPAVASLLDGNTTLGTAESPSQSIIATYQVVTDQVTDATAQERPAHVLAPTRSEGGEGGELPSGRMGARSHTEAPAPAGNPLWALPLEQLSITRERPIFSPSRRPPSPPPTYVTPVAVQQPVKPPEPERLAVSLIGTAIGTDVHIAVFLETKTQNVVRLRVGEAHQGWVLRLVKAREVTLVKGVEQTLVLETRPGEASALRGPVVSPPVPNSIGIIPVSTASYVDEQPLPARGARGQRR